MDFEEQIKQSYRKEISDRDECPEAEDLIRYKRHELSTEEMLRMKKHVDICGSCDCVLVQLSEFDFGPEASWRESLKRFFLHPALAYGLALALLYPAYRGLFQSAPVDEKVIDGTGSAMDFDLGQGSVTRSTTPGEEIVVALHPAERFFILTFFVPVRNGYRYEMEIQNEQGIVIDSKRIRSRDSIGNFSIVATASLFPDGNYKLAVKEVDSAKKAIKNEYSFDFRIQRKSES